MVTRMRRVRLIVTILALPLCAFAQEPASPPPPPPPPEPPGQAELPAPPDTSPDTRLDDLERRLAAVETAAPAPLPKTDAIEKLKFSGYVQGRYEWHDDANFGVDPVSRAPRGTSRFLARRARLKATYTGANMQYLVQFGANHGETVAVSDAEATFIDTWTPLNLRITVGQFKVPFGFEVLQSSSEREMPERALVATALFPGERDRGVRLLSTFSVVRISAAIINGTGLNDRLYTHHDQTSWKDLVGRLGVDLGFLAGGASAYWGHALRTALPTAPGTPPTYSRYDRLRLGADAQASLPTPRIGRTVLRGEVIWARDENIAFSGSLPDRCKDVRTLGWIATVVQRVGERRAIFLRADQFDPTRNVPDSCPGQLASFRRDGITTFGGGVLLESFEKLRLTVAYAHVVEQQGQTVENDVLWTQLQAKF